MIILCVLLCLHHSSPKAQKKLTNSTGRSSELYILSLADAGKRIRCITLRRSSLTARRRRILIGGRVLGTRCMDSGQSASTSYLKIPSAKADSACGMVGCRVCRSK
jgi:hypothetical protein